MKKILLILLAASTTGLYASASELAEALREANGKIEELQRQVEDNRKEIAELKRSVNKISGQGETAKTSENTDDYKESNGKISDIDAKNLIKKVSRMIESGEYSDAWKILDNFVSKEQNKLYMGQACFYSGKVLYLQGKYSDAIKFFIKSAQMNPRGNKAPEALYLLANSLDNLKKEQPKDKEKLQAMLTQTLQSIREMGKEAEASVAKNPNLVTSDESAPYYLDSIRYGKWAGEKL